MANDSGSDSEMSGSENDSDGHGKQSDADGKHGGGAAGTAGVSEEVREKARRVCA